MGIWTGRGRENMESLFPTVTLEVSTPQAANINNTQESYRTSTDRNNILPGEHTMLNLFSLLWKI